MADEPTIHSLLIAAEDGDSIPANDDEKLAQELQLQELLVVISPPPSNTSFIEQGETSGTKVDEFDCRTRRLMADEPTIRSLLIAAEEGDSIPADDDEKLAQEQGETSGTKVVDEFDCNICMETKGHSERFSTETCPHAFCNSCMSRYIAAQVEANAASVKCPDPQCRLSAAPALHPDTCRSILPAAVFDRWGVALCESALGARKFYCPYADCAALVVKEEEDEEMTDAVCPHCERGLCATCRVASHVGVSCEEFRRLDEGERGREDLMLRELAKNSKWQRCPECKMYVERIDGCRFMSCRCGHFFCDDCSSPMQQNNHACVKCDRV